MQSVYSPLEPDDSPPRQYLRNALVYTLLEYKSFFFTVSIQWIAFSRL